MLTFFLFLAAMTQSPKTAGAKAAAAAPAAATAPAPAKKTNPAGASSGSYLVKVIDPAQQRASGPEPCVAIDRVTGAGGKAVVVAAMGSAYTVTLKLAGGATDADVASVSVDGTELVENAQHRYVYPLTPKADDGSVEATVQAAHGHTLKCTATVALSVPVVGAKCGKMKFIAASGGGGAVMDATTMQGLLGAPPPLTLKAQGSRIYVYSSSNKASANDAALSELEKEVALLSAAPARTGGGLAVEIAVPGVEAKDTPPVAGSKKFKVTVADAGRLEIAESTGAASCEEWLAELNEVEKKTLPRVGESRMSQLFYLASASDTADVLSKTIPASAGPAKPADASAPSGDDAGAGTGTLSGAGAPGTSGDGSGGSGGSGGTAAAGAPAADASKPAGQAAGGTGDTSGVKKGGGAGGSDGSAFTVQGLQKDLLVFGGDDASVHRAKQMLAMLDLPRPEMILNTWILQASTTNADEIGRFSETARRLVAENNEVLQGAIARGWVSLAESSKQAGFFDEPFYRYITYRYIDDSGEESTVDEAGRKADDARRDAMGICPREQYCLGYTTLFAPLRPRLTDLLLTMIASRDRDKVLASINVAENGGEVPDPALRNPPQCDSAPCKDLRGRLSIVEDTGCRGASCMTAAQNATDRNGCGLRDLERLVDSTGTTNLQLECLRDVLDAMFTHPQTQYLARAAIADFLYQYKTSQQYPAEFSPYNLTLSADTLNTALAPFIDAFNRDVRAFQDYLNNVVRMKVDSQTGGGKAVTFTDTGLVSVRTVSVNPAEVSSTTQSSLDTGEFPDIATVAANLLGGGSGSGSSSSSGSTTTSAASAAAGLLSANEATMILGALKSFQTSTAQIGRQIDVKVTPRSLTGASAAEMDVTLKVDDTGTPPSKYTGTTSSALNLSRVATHDTTTHVRVDSLKLFEVSGVGAQLTLSRPPIPLILPLVEIPYVGSLVGIPRKPAEEYHSSVAIMSAIVVPTAADLAYGITFVDDRIVVAPPGSCRMPWMAEDANKLAACMTLTAASQYELGGPVHSFHRVKRQCLATGGEFGYSSLTAVADGGVCGTLTFERLIPET